MATAKIILLINIWCKLSLMCIECGTAMETPYSNDADEFSLGESCCLI